MRVFIATSNAGKLHDFAAAAKQAKVETVALPGFQFLPSVGEDCATFEANARKKAEFYSDFAPGELVVADDSGLEVAALDGAPGVRSARYAADVGLMSESGSQSEVDAANNERLLVELGRLNNAPRDARFVCVLAVAQDGKTIKTFAGEVQGDILTAPLGHAGFGYDPLFRVSRLGKTLAEMSAEEKTAVSHRGAAFRKFLDWLTTQPPCCEVLNTTDPFT